MVHKPRSLVSVAGSVSGEEVKTRGKLSDGRLGESSSSILSDREDVESIKSAASDRNISKSAVADVRILGIIFDLLSLIFFKLIIIIMSSFLLS